MLLKIKNPIWHSRSVGINNNLKTCGVIDIEITYTRVGGERVWPGRYRIFCKNLAKYPSQFVAGGKVELKIVPIKDLKQVI